MKHMTSLQQEKKTEADGLMKRAKKLMEKTMFQWKPDYLAAAPLLEKAAELYRSAGDLDQAKRVFAQAAVVQTKNKSSFRAAQNCENAAKIILQQIKAIRVDSSEKQALVKELRASYEGACTHFSDMGELGKGAEALMKGASACEEAGGGDTKDLYLRACSLMEAQGKPHFAVEVFRKTFTFLVKKEFYRESLALIKRQIALYADMDQVNNIFKCQLSEIILLLTLGDVAAADAAYMEHLQSDAFLKSDECALIEDLVRSFKTGNEELLQIAVRKQGITFLDQSIGRLARKLTIYGGGTSTSGPPPASSSSSSVSRPPPAPKNPFVSVGGAGGAGGAEESMNEFEDGVGNETEGIKEEEEDQGFNFDALEFASSSSSPSAAATAPPPPSSQEAQEEEETGGEDVLDLT